jgi:ABC-type branched-subunit amino acid transport system ATPase component/ABC-type branched-subunit amino acid transport system permease subunit
MFAGVLFAPEIELLASGVLGVVLGAFAAAAIGGFRRLSSTFLGGLLIGVLVSVSSRYAATNSRLASVPTVIPLFVLVVVILVRSRHVTEESGRGFVLGGFPRISGVRGLLIGVAVVGAILIQALHSNESTAVSVGFSYVMIFLGLNVLLRSGQVSLGQAMFASLGGAALAHFGSTGLGLPWEIAWLLGLVVAALVGTAVAAITARLPVVYVALATLAIGYVVEEGLFQSRFMFSGPESVAAPTLAFPYYTTFILALVSVAWLVWQYRGRFGRLLAAFAEGSQGVRSFGLSTFRLTVLVFALSSMLAATGGALLSGITGSASQPEFDFTLSLLWFASVGLGVGSVIGSVVPAIVVGVLPTILPVTSQYLVVVLGVGAVIMGLVGARLGARVYGGNADEVVGASISAGDATARSDSLDDTGTDIERVSARSRISMARGGPRELAPVFPKGPTFVQGLRAPVLTVANVTVRFGGLVALDDVSLEIPEGQITGLIGPNGSGKSTLVGVVAGAIRPSAGEVKLGDRSLGFATADERARLGIGRTFQGGSLFGSLTVVENVMAAWECGRVGGRPWRALRWSGREGASARDVAHEALEQVGIEGLGGRRARDLSTGDQRLVEVARILACGFKVALLDECASGLDGAARRRFADLLVHVAHDVGITVVLVEHDLNLVERIAERVVVLGEGQVVQAGGTSEVLSGTEVRELYTGEPDSRTGGSR